MTKAIRIQEEIYEAIEKLALQEQRSITQMANILLEKAVETAKQ